MIQKNKGGRKADNTNVITNFLIFCYFSKLKTFGKLFVTNNEQWFAIEDIRDNTKIKVSHTIGFYVILKKFVAWSGEDIVIASVEISKTKS